MIASRRSKAAIRLLLAISMLITFVVLIVYASDAYINDRCYMENYPDVAELYYYGHNHFEDFGRKEGRQYGCA